MKEKQPTDLEAWARRIITQHPKELARIKGDMQDFDIPAQRSINAGFNRMGVSRFTLAGDDLWEMITAVESGWEYARPARHLMQRWASY
jgi:hypothetical protein